MRKATLATVPRLQCKVSCICDHEMPALSMRERLSAFAIFRLMKKHGLLLQRYTGRRRPGEHDGKIITIRSNIRWCADALEFTCWNGEIVRIAFVLDCHDREVIAWLATTAGISGEMIRDMMIECGERRFGGSRAPHNVQFAHR